MLLYMSSSEDTTVRTLRFVSRGLKGRDTLCDISLRHIAATCCIVCDKAARAYFVAAICRTNSIQFEFVRQIAATKFCRSDKDFHTSHEAICCSNLSRRRVAAICPLVCLGFNKNWIGQPHPRLKTEETYAMETLLIYHCYSCHYYCYCYYQ